MDEIEEIMDDEEITKLPNPLKVFDIDNIAKDIIKCWEENEKIRTGFMDLCFDRAGNLFLALIHNAEGSIFSDNAHKNSEKCPLAIDMQKMTYVKYINALKNIDSEYCKEIIQEIIVKINIQNKSSLNIDVLSGALISKYSGRTGACMFYDVRR